MTSRERILSTVRGRDTDHVPLHIDVHPSYLSYDPTVAHWDDQFQRTDDLLALGTDPMIEVWLPDPVAHPDVKITTWREDNPPDGVPRLGKAYETPRGTLRQVIRETDDLYQWHRINRNTRGPLADLIDGVGLLEDVNPSRSCAFLINGPQDLDAMEYLFMPPQGDALSRWRRDADYAAQQARERGVCLLARRLYAGAALLWLTDATESICTFDEHPQYVQRFLDIIGRTQRRHRGVLDRRVPSRADQATDRRARRSRHHHADPAGLPGRRGDVPCEHRPPVSGCDHVPGKIRSAAFLNEVNAQAPWSAACEHRVQPRHLRKQHVIFLVDVIVHVPVERR